ncbi:histidinol-phosphatase [Mesorhizobium sp. B2-4-15]|uniref:histidinol-phosphatase n=1 Tax=Mesorhizobium sp. B2-4-15 TaxID=2589934 RepID=UPI0011504E78|nr:histidinol-phosphatase [Mesorhizobium sp. B2-4-15]TPK62428.1 histidinol-phosphatase [Mesorhizobium sp. B2-4-15]
MPDLPDISFFHRLADAAAEVALSYYRKPIEVEEKVKPGYRFDPVTIADKKAEEVIRELIAAQYPDHAVLGEEFGESGDGPIKWIIDPIDGTRPFICGIPVWGTLIGLTVEGKARMGMMSQPYTGERFWAAEAEAWTSTPSGSRRLRTRPASSLATAILHTNSPDRFPDFPSINFARLRNAVQMIRYGGECYAFAMLAAGQIDLCLEESMQPYDIAALIPIIEMAGGVVTNLDGEPAENGGAILASASLHLHQAALALINS